MKIKTQVVVIGIFILTSGCTTTKNINTDNKVNTFVYNTKCKDKTNKDTHIFKTISYLPLSNYQVLQKVYTEGINNSLNMSSMNCIQTVDNELI